MGLAAGGYFAGVFHLTTHAGFKALLFLCSGIFIHEFHTNDFRVIGKHGGRALKIPMACMTIGALGLCGIFPFSGFFSKEAILGVLAQHPNKLWLGAGLVGALMTAYYTFRLIFFMLFPRGEAAHAGAHGDDHGHGHGGEEGEHHGYIFWCMAVPVMILAGVTLVLGFSQSSLEHFLMGGVSAGHGAAEGAHGAEGGHGAGHYMLLISAVSMAVGGILWAFYEFGRKGAKQEGFLKKFPAVEELFARRWYLDDFLRKALDKVVYGGLTNMFTRNDRRVIDGAIDGICAFTIGSGRLFSFLQSGMLQQNLLVMVAAVGLVVLFFLFA
jgi:NADH-quinone oxidoreductase subunit L